MPDTSDLLEQYRCAAGALASALQDLEVDEADFTPAPGKWTIRQIVAHLADTELVAAYRFRLVIAENNPTIFAFNQEDWARNLDYAHRPPQQSLDTLRTLRAGNYELLKSLPDAAYERTGNHSVNGPTTLRQMIESFTRHVNSHTRQVQTIRETYRHAIH